MRIIVVDDEWLALAQFELEMKGIDWIEVVGTFQDPKEALVFMEQTEVDVVISDIEMGDMNGLEFANILQNTHPNVLVVFVTGYEQYALEAFKEHAFGYLLKPFDREEMLVVLEKAKGFQKTVDKLEVKTFGRFDVFGKGGVIVFRNAKAKELLALCIDRVGGSVTMEEAIDKLWAEREYDSRVKNLYRKAVASVRLSLADCGMDHVFFAGRGNCHIQKDMCNCDYFTYLETGIGDYTGAYMFPYEWAEDTIIVLDAIEPMEQEEESQEFERQLVLELEEK